MFSGVTLPMLMAPLLAGFMFWGSYVSLEVWTSPVWLLQGCLSFQILLCQLWLLHGAGVVGQEPCVTSVKSS